ncbi:MAG: cell division protein FtsA [Patescibacteria group bacterium]
MSRSDLVTGIDIGSSKITTLVAQYFPEEERINVIGVARTKANGIRKGQIVNIEQATESLIESVEAAERMAGSSISSAFIGISASHISSVNSQGVVAVADSGGEISDTDVTRVIEAARAVSLPSSREIIHVIPRQFTVDGQQGVITPNGMNGVRLEVEAHIVTASCPAIKNLSKSITEAGVQISGFVFSGFAAAESVLTSTEKELGVVLVDIGAGTTTVSIYTESAPCYSAVLPVGASNVTNDLAVGLRVSLENAEKIKIALAEIIDEKDKAESIQEDDEIELKKLGIVDDENHKISIKTSIDGIISPRLHELFALIGEEIKKSGFGGTTPAGVVLTGGGAKTIGAKSTCQRVLGLPVRIGIPEKIGGIVDDILSPEYASSLGVILYSIKQKQVQKTFSFKFASLSKFKTNLPIKGIFGRLGEIIKPLLP